MSDHFARGSLIKQQDILPKYDKTGHAAQGAKDDGIGRKHPEEKLGPKKTAGTCRHAGEIRMFHGSGKRAQQDHQQSHAVEDFLLGDSRVYRVPMGLVNDMVLEVFIRYLFLATL